MTYSLEQYKEKRKKAQYTQKSKEVRKVIDNYRARHIGKYLYRVKLNND